jgi:hypothetical protein
MKQTFILPIVALALFSGLAAAQTSSSQKSVIISHGDQVEVQLTDANGKVTTYTGATTADAIAKSQSKISSVKDTAPMSNDRHLIQSASETTQAKSSLVKKNQSESISNAKPTPVMPQPMVTESSAPKN